ncbi:hypothetical protein [Streptomyces sp. SYSU K21746]
MSEIFVMYELDQPRTARSVTGTSGTSPVGERPVLRVHAAPAAPVSAAPGPRTLCGRDTFAMDAAPSQAAEHPGSAWYAPQDARLVCAQCDAAMEG